MLALTRSCTWGCRRCRCRRRCCCCCCYCKHSEESTNTFISWWTVTVYVYNTVYSELTACNPTFTRWLQHRYKQSRLCVTKQWPRQPQT